ncbi:MAG: hypothetical protein ACRECO_10640 [Xanthobacteraceae bacterium]
MIARLRAFAALAFVFALAAAPALQAQEPVYKQIGANSARHLAEGLWVETRGHTWLSPGGSAFVTINQPSAMVPTRVDVTNVAPASIGRLKAACSALNQFHGGCNTIVRGRIGMVGKEKGIIAREIEILPR